MTRSSPPPAHEEQDFHPELLEPHALVKVKKLHNNANKKENDARGRRRRRHGPKSVQAFARSSTRPQSFGSHKTASWSCRQPPSSTACRCRRGTSLHGSRHARYAGTAEAAAVRGRRPGLPPAVVLKPPPRPATAARQPLRTRNPPRRTGHTTQPATAANHGARGPKRRRPTSTATKLRAGPRQNQPRTHQILSVIVAQKNHHTRFFQTGSPENVPPGKLYVDPTFLMECDISVVM